MARSSSRSGSGAPQKASVTPEQIKIGVRKLERRLQELEDFDPDTVESRDDPRIASLEASVDDGLASVFGEGTPRYNRYREAAHIDTAGYNYLKPTPLHEIIEGLTRGKATAIELLTQALKSLKEELDLRGAVTTAEEVGFVSVEVAPSREVFVVHGHDNEAKLAVARFLERIDLNPVILHEQADQGRTIIEKFSDHAGNVGFAVVLLTPDDLGGARAKDDGGKCDLKPRARQNVILELGFFIGKLGRSNVCALHKGGVEIPSDYQGVLFKPMDDGGAWQLELARELKASGLEIDFNKVIG